MNLFLLYLDTPSYWETRTMAEKIHMCLWVAFFVISFLLRNTKLGFLWKGIKIFFIVLAATLVLDYAKKSIKEWWNKN